MMNRIGLMGANPGMRRPFAPQEPTLQQPPQLTPQQIAMLRQRMQQGGMPGQPQQPQMSQPFAPPRAW